MMRRSFHRGELLLAVLELLEGTHLTGTQIIVELQALLGLEYFVKASEVFIALEALEEEGLVTASAVDGSALYRITSEGLNAVSRRADAAVIARAERAEPPKGDVIPLEGFELVQVAILFTDLVGSTELMDRLGDDVAHHLRRRHFALLRRAVRAEGGREIKNLGDGLMIAFDSPPAAVTCALAMQRSVSADADALELRIGIASGETVHEDDDYFGRPVVVAQRLCDAAQGGDVLVSELTRKLISGSSKGDFEPLGPLVLKGLSEPITAAAVRAMSA